MKITLPIEKVIRVDFNTGEASTKYNKKLNLLWESAKAIGATSRKVGNLVELDVPDNEADLMSAKVISLIYVNGGEVAGLRFFAALDASEICPFEGFDTWQDWHDAQAPHIVTEPLDGMLYIGLHPGGVHMNYEQATAFGSEEGVNLISRETFIAKLRELQASK